MRFQVVLVCATIGLAAGGAGAEPLELLGVATQANALPIQVGPGNDSACRVEELARLVREGRQLAGAGVAVLDGPKGAAWTVTRTRAAAIVAEFDAAIPADGPDAADERRAAEAMEQEYRKLQATRRRILDVALPTAEAVLRPAIALKVETEYPGLAGYVQDRFGRRTVAFHSGTMPERPGRPLVVSDESAMELLPPALLNGLNDIIRQRALPRADSGTQQGWYRIRTAQVPLAESAEGVEARYARLTALLRAGQSLVPANRTVYLPLRSATFQQFEALSSDFGTAHVAYVHALDAQLAAQLGEAERAFQQGVVTALAAVPYERNLALAQRSIEIDQLVSEAMKIRARMPDSLTEPFMDDPHRPRYAWLGRNAGVERLLAPSLVSVWRADLSTAEHGRLTARR